MVVLVLGALLCADVRVFPAQRDIRLEVHGTAPSPARVVFFAPHENEAVANAYLARRLHGVPARFFVLRQHGERHVTFTLGDATYALDPNRMFTRAGVAASLLGLNDHLVAGTSRFFEVQARALALGRFVLGSFGPLAPDATVVTLHNNTPGYDNDGRGGVGTISIKRYLKKLQGGSVFLTDVHVGRGDEDDLFYVTDPADFAALKKQRCNVVLQNPRVAVIPDEDDGSLSVWAAMAGYRYINIEAQRKDDAGRGRDHLRKQKAMVRRIMRLTGLTTGRGR